MPAASYAVTVMVRFEPVGTVIVPDAVLLWTFKLNVKEFARSGAVTVTTTVVIAVEVKDRYTWSCAEAALGAVDSREQAPSNMASVTRSPRLPVNPRTVVSH